MFHVLKSLLNLALVLLLSCSPAAAQVVYTVDLRNPAIQSGARVLQDDLVEVSSGRQLLPTGANLLYNLPKNLFENKLYVVHAIVAVDAPYNSPNPWVAAQLVCYVENRPGAYFRKLGRSDGFEEYAFYIFLKNDDSGARIGIDIPRNMQANIRLKKLWVETYGVVDDKFPYVLPGNEAGTHLSGVLDISRAQVINKYLFGYNTILPRTRITFSSPIFKTTFKDFQPGAVRFPGGTFANFYDWRSDSIAVVPSWAPDFVESSIRIRKQNGTEHFGYADLAAQTKGIDSDMIIVLNINDIPLPAIIGWVKDLRSRGLKAKYFELGNEVYDNKQVDEKFRSPGKYIARAKQIAALLKNFDPTIQVGIVARPPGYADIESDAWNKHMAKFDFYDGVVVHTYNKQDGAAYDNAMKKAFLSPESHVKDFLDYYKQTFGLSKPLWNTEWNALNLFYRTIDFGSLSGKRPFKFTGPVLSMLHTAGYLLTILNNSDRFEIASMHALGPSDDDFGFLDYSGEQTTNWALTYTYFALRMLNHLADESSKHFPVSVNENASPLAVGFERVLAHGFVGKDGVMRVVLLNKLPIEKLIDLQLNNKKVMHFNSQSYISGSRLNDEISLPLGRSPMRDLIPTLGVLKLPPYSLSVVELAY